MKHKLWYDEKDEVIHLEFMGDYFTAEVEPIRQKILELVEGKSNRQMVIQISKNAKVENRETRELSNQIFQDAQITEVAFIGGSAANRMIAKVLLKTSTMKVKGDFFKTIEEGIDWIKSRR